MGAEGALAERLPLRILIAEDNLINQKVTRLMLESLGYRADVVENGLEAVNAVIDGGHDMVLMDLEMPVMGGLEATRMIRATLPADRQPRIVAMTANAIEGNAQQCIDAGMNGYMAKPVRKDRLVDMLIELATAEPVVAGSEGEGGAGCVDRGRIEELRREIARGNPAMIGELIAAFIREALWMIERIEASAAAAEPVILRRTAHSLKSSSAIIGARGIAEIARRLEEAGRAGEMSGTGEMLRSLRDEFAKARPELEAISRELQPPPHSPSENL
jgi:CheY-like chemotaxis protein